MEEYKIIGWIIIGAIWLYSTIKNRNASLKKNTPQVSNPPIKSASQELPKVKTLLSNRQKADLTLPPVKPPVLSAKDLIGSYKPKKSSIPDNVTSSTNPEAKRYETVNYDINLKDEEQVTRELTAQRITAPHYILPSDLRKEDVYSAKSENILLEMLKNPSELKKGVILSEILEKKF